MMQTEPLFFFGKDKPNGWLSQFYPARFTDADGRTFTCCEQYMMHGKALLFGDKDVAALILACDKPQKIKALGRKVKGFDDGEWAQHRFDIVRAGNGLKFRQNNDLRERLLATGDRELAEASPFDRIWGIGMGAEKAQNVAQAKWGLNLLGKALMEVRSELQGVA
jgi:ribA/ribD-fused uncharacterized protein